MKFLLANAIVSKDVTVDQVGKWLANFAKALAGPVIYSDKSVFCGYDNSYAVAEIDDCGVLSLVRLSMWHKRAFDVSSFFLSLGNVYNYEYVLLNKNLKEEFKYSEQLIPIISLMNDADRAVYESAQGIGPKSRTPEQRKAVYLYNKLNKKFGLKTVC